MVFWAGITSLLRFAFDIQLFPHCPYCIMGQFSMNIKNILESKRYMILHTDTNSALAHAQGAQEIEISKCLSCFCDSYLTDPNLD